MRFPFEADRVEDVARLARASGEWVLRRRTSAAGLVRHEMILDGKLLMDDSEGASEEDLARAALRACPDHPGLRVLVAGLGFGFTLRAVLEDRRVETVDVVELEPELPATLARLGGSGWISPVPLDDPRVRVEIGDACPRLASTVGRWDCVLLDVDNGPESLALPGNAWLYGVDGLSACSRALTPGGALCIWSSEPSPGCLARMRRVFGDAEELTVPVRREGRRIVYRIFRSVNGRAPGPVARG